MPLYKHKLCVCASWAVVIQTQVCFVKYIAWKTPSQNMSYLCIHKINPQMISSRMHLSCKYVLVAC